jgi:hypothetical protein
MFDQGLALPKRRVQSLFIIVAGKAYPAYFILTLAHRLATGHDKHKKWEKSTAKSIFKTLGVEVRRASPQFVRSSSDVPVPGKKNGRPKLPPTERGRTIALYLKPVDQAVFLRYGKTVQDGLRALILAAKE